MGDGEDAVDEVEAFVAFVFRLGGLNANVEEAHAIVELLDRRMGLAAD